MRLPIFRKFVSSSRAKSFGAAYNRGAETWNRRFSKSPLSRYMNPQRAAESLGESFVLRKALSPVLVPMKIWVAYKLCL
jgi:hypothetical protein